MIIEKLELKDFRNYSALDLALSPNINIVIGPNAQGKTNIIEAIYYASLAHSHRTHRDAELLRWHAPAGQIALTFSRLGVKNTLSFQFIRDRRRQILLNEHPVRPKELIGSIKSVLFSPEDLVLIKGSPSERRAFLDRELSQANPAYYQDLLDYNRILKHRSALLKRIREHAASCDALEIWDAQLIPKAAAITKKRIEATKKLSMLANLMHRRITTSAENLSVSYDVYGKGADVTESLVSWYNHMLKQNQRTDILRGITGIGPHRDDLIFHVNGANLKTFGSQGQQRTGVLSLKLAELEFLHAETGEYPILLLDDVMSELDITRRRALLSFLRHEHIQTVITATDEAYFPDTAMGVFYHVRSGRIMR